MNDSAKPFMCFVCLLGFCFAAASARGDRRNMGLAVEPGWLLIPNVPIGQLYDMESRTGTRFTIHNGSDQPRRFTLKVDKPQQVGAKILKGYTSLPDPAWFWFEKTEVSVPANGASEVTMFLRIPDEEQYCNQKWAVGIDVEGKPEAGEGLVLAVAPVFYIETEARAETAERPAGSLGLTPATLVLDHTASAKNRATSTIKVFNNDNRPHDYRIRSMIPSAAPGRQVIAPSPGFSWIPRQEWLKPGICFSTIGPHEQATITIAMDIPENSTAPGHRWEGIVFFESEEGLAAFARVQMTTSTK